MSLTGKKVLLLVEQGYEELEFWYPKLRMLEEGAEVTVASRETGIYHSKRGYPAKAEHAIRNLTPITFDAVIIPGGLKCPDLLRTSNAVLKFLQKSNELSKVIAFICHAAWVPISAGILEGRRATCYASIKDDVENAGGKYEYSSVVQDGNLISSRNPADLPDFCRTIISALQRSTPA